jgi:hypothetical protein
VYVRSTLGSDVSLDFGWVYGYCLRSGDRLLDETIFCKPHLGTDIGDEWALGLDLTGDFGPMYEKAR